MSRQWAGLYAQRVLTWAWANLPHVCSICGQPITAGPGSRLADGRRDPHRASVEHALARSRGGSDHVSNLRLAHMDCNSSKGARTSAPNRRTTDHREWFTGHTTTPTTPQAVNSSQPSTHSGTATSATPIFF